jgi:peptidoglycan hydrolase CwlO-like protein
MLRKLLPENYEIDRLDLESGILQSLKNIELQLQKELAFKQKTIEESWAEIKSLHTLIAAKDQDIQELQAKLADSKRNIEGNRQLINKLLSDLTRMRQDIEWYKRTYEKRSLLGTIKQKLYTNRRNKGK